MAKNMASPNQIGATIWKYFVFFLYFPHMDFDPQIDMQLLFEVKDLLNHIIHVIVNRLKIRT